MSEEKQTGEVIKIQISPQMRDMLIAISEASKQEAEMDTQARTLLVQRLQEFKTAWIYLQGAWMLLNDSSQYGADNYPFPLSFDEMITPVCDWVESFTDEVKEAL